MRTGRKAERGTKRSTGKGAERRTRRRTERGTERGTRRRTRKRTIRHVKGQLNRAVATVTGAFVQNFSRSLF